MKKTILVFLLVSNLYSQGSEEWVRYFDGSLHSFDRTKGMVVDNAGNIIVTGYTQNVGTNEDYTTIKYNSEGDTLWVREFNHGNSDEATAIALDTSGNVYVSGTSSQYILTIKYSSEGSLIWMNKLRENNAFLSVSAIKVDVSGNVYVLGSSQNDGFIILKYDTNGQPVWDKKYYNGLGGEATGIDIDNTGNIVICGYIYFTNDDWVTIKYNPSGDTLWTRKYNTGAYEHPFAITVDTFGNVYVTGESLGSPFNYGSYVYTTIKYDLNGNPLWLRNYNGFGNDADYAQCIAIDATNNIYITGVSSTPLNGLDFATIKYNSNGDSLWVRRYNGPDNLDDMANSMTFDNSGNVYIAGTSTEINGYTDYAIVKYNPEGVLQWTQRYHNPSDSNIYSNSIKVDSKNNVFISGGCIRNNTYDFLTIKYSNTIGIQPISTEIPNKFSLSQNYPNPFNPSTKIRFDLPKSSLASVVIYDVLGREVETLFNQQVTAGDYEVEWNAVNYPSGVYFYKLTAGNFKEIRKMVLIK